MAKFPHTFHNFRDLPKELQTDIWKHAIDSTPSRVVNLRQEPIRMSHSNESPKDNVFPGSSSQLTSPCPIPSLLHACRDSRALASNRWQLACGHSHSDTSETAVDSSPKVFLDFTRDILWLEDVKMASFTQFASAKQRQAIRNIAFDVNRAVSRGTYIKGGCRMAQVRKELPFLECIVLMRNGNGNGDMLEENSKKSLVCLVEHAEIGSSHVMHTLDAFWRGFAGVPSLAPRPRTARSPALKYMDYSMYEKGSEMREAWDAQDLASSLAS